MSRSCPARSARVIALFAALAGLQASAQELSPPVGPGKVVVHTALGGFILGYDIDATGDEGLLSEALTHPDGTYDVAVEAFSQKTGKITKIIKQQSNSKNDYVTLGIFGNSVGLTEYEQSSDIFVDRRSYHLTNPLASHRFTGKWTPPFKGADHIISGVAQGQGGTTAAFLGFINDGRSFHSYVFSSDVAANTFGPVIEITDMTFDWNISPVIALDEKKHEAVLGGSLGCFNCNTWIDQVNLVSGKSRETFGLGKGGLNGIAVDSDKQIACTTSEDDFSVEFYDLVKRTQKIVVLPGAQSQVNSGAAVAVDPIHHLFLIGQEFSSTAGSGSSIHVYDTDGNLVESLNGFSLPASPAPMVLNPARRTGFVIVTPQLTSLQSFTY